MNSSEFLGIRADGTIGDIDAKTLAGLEDEVEDDDVVEAEEEGDDDLEESILREIRSMKPKVVNIIASVNLGTQLDLMYIATHTRNAEYNPKRFSAVNIRIQEPKATALIFKTGTMNIVGCRTEEAAMLAARKFTRILALLKFKVSIEHFNIASMVATCSCGFEISLEQLAHAQGHSKFSSFNPETFAGLIYKIPQPRVTVILFHSGKMILTGAKNIQTLNEAAEWIYPVLVQFEKKPFIPDQEPAPEEII